VQNFIVSNWSLLKIGTTQAQKKLFFKLNQAKSAIRSMLGNDNLQEAAIVLDVKESEVIEMDQRLRGECSLDAELEPGSGLTMLDSLPDNRLSQEELLSDRQEAAVLQKEVARAMETLNDKERYIIEHRVAAEEPATLQEIAERFAISRERVRQIEEGARKKLRNLLTPLILDAVAA
jgi:RNA polymerase sigma-32 factor